MLHNTSNKVYNQCDLTRVLMKRSRKNRTGLWLEENERDEIEHIIDEMNPTKLQREDIDPDESEDFQVNFLNINILF